MSVKEFYEQMHGDNRTHRPKPPFLYRKLRKFELNKYDLVLKVIEEGNSIPRDKV